MFVLAILMISLASTLGETTVKYAAVVYQHGDATPVKPYPTDPWQKESLWPVKFGQLTNEGKSQQYALGKWLRNRYSHLISEKYDPSEINVKSTDVDVTLMSAQANLAGMYPPSGSSVWNSNISWQPIPVHTLPEKKDELLAMKKVCLEYTKEETEYTNSRTYKKKISKYQGLMNFLTIHTGKMVNDFGDICEIYNILNIESLHNFTLPTWTQSVYPNKLQEPACYSYTTSTATPTMARLMVGPLLKEIVANMDVLVFETKPNPLKLSIYSAQDFQIGNILSAMGVFDGNCPVFTATVFFELLEDTSTKEYFIKMLYRNSTQIVEPYVLNIPSCGKICPFERFLDVYTNLLTVNWEDECTPRLSVKFLICHTIFVMNMTLIAFRIFY